jgi:hypothetical protein
MVKRYRRAGGLVALVARLSTSLPELGAVETHVLGVVSQFDHDAYRRVEQLAQHRPHVLEQFAQVQRFRAAFLQAAEVQQLAGGGNGRRAADSVPSSACFSTAGSSLRRARDAWPRIKPSRWLKSWVTPLANCPVASTFIADQLPLHAFALGALGFQRGIAAGEAIHLELEAVAGTGQVVAALVGGVQLLRSAATERSRIAAMTTNPIKVRNA